MSSARNGRRARGRSPGVYARLLAFLPRSFRGEPEAEMLAAFEQAWSEARRSGRLAVARLWLMSLWDLLVTVTRRRDSP